MHGHGPFRSSKLAPPTARLRLIDIVFWLERKVRGWRHAHLIPFVFFVCLGLALGFWLEWMERQRFI